MLKPIRVMSPFLALLPGIPAASAQVLVNFDTYPGGAPAQPGDIFTTQWAPWGVVFSDNGGGGVGPANNPCSYSAPNHASSGAGLIVATFVDPCTGRPSATDMAGTRQDWCWAPGEGIDMYAFDASGALLDHQFNSGGGNLVTFSYPRPVIARLDMYLLGQGIDDFIFNAPPPSPCPPDITGNGIINIDDLLAVINGWGPCVQEPFGCSADLTCNGAVNIDDLLAVVNAWGPCP